MTDEPTRSRRTARVIRPGDERPPEDDWLDRPMEERIEAVSMLTAICFGWNSDDSRVPRHQDLLSTFNAHGVEFLVVGAHALAAHGHVRATKDLDVWVRPESDNARRTLAALRAFGAPLHGLTEGDLSRPGLIFQIGVPPLRIDVITAIDGVDFDNAWRNRVATRFAGEPGHVLSIPDLIANKKACGRLQDLADVEQLERLLAQRRRPQT